MYSFSIPPSLVPSDLFPKRLGDGKRDNVMTRKLRAGILGATGTVGQRFIQMLEHHPQFVVTAVAASERSENKPYADATTWGEIRIREAAVRPVAAAAARLRHCFLSLPSEMAQASEEGFARAGYPVISNSSACRMHTDVPLLIPEVNHDHLRLLDNQRSSWGFTKGDFLTVEQSVSRFSLRRSQPQHEPWSCPAQLGSDSGAT